MLPILSKNKSTIFMTWLLTTVNKSIDQLFITEKKELKTVKFSARIDPHLFHYFAWSVPRVADKTLSHLLLMMRGSKAYTITGLFIGKQYFSCIWYLNQCQLIRNHTLFPCCWWCLYPGGVGDNDCWSRCKCAEEATEAGTPLVTLLPVVAAARLAANIFENKRIK